MLGLTPPRHTPTLRQAAIRNGPADESPSSLKSNSHGWRCLAERKLRLRVRQYGERYLWFESISLHQPFLNSGVIRVVSWAEAIWPSSQHVSCSIKRRSWSASTPRQ